MTARDASVARAQPCAGAGRGRGAFVDWKAAGAAHNNSCARAVTSPAVDAGSCRARRDPAFKAPAGTGYVDTISPRSRDADRKRTAELQRYQVALNGRLRRAELGQARRALDAEVRSLEEADDELA